MSAVQLRPTFLLNSGQGEASFNCIRRAVLDNSAEFQGQFAKGHAMVSIAKSKRHFWSPWLHLEIRQDESSYQVYGRFSPHPSIWTGFVFSYLSISVLGFFALVFGFSQQMAGESPWAYLFLPIGLLVAVGLWFASKIGQRLANQEMQRMKRLIESCVQSQKPDA